MSGDANGNGESSLICWCACPVWCNRAGPQAIHVAHVGASNKHVEVSDANWWSCQSPKPHASRNNGSHPGILHLQVKCIAYGMLFIIQWCAHALWYKCQACVEITKAVLSNMPSQQFDVELRAHSDSTPYVSLNNRSRRYLLHLPEILLSSKVYKGYLCICVNCSSSIKPIWTGQKAWRW